MGEGRRREGARRRRDHVGSKREEKKSPRWPCHGERAARSLRTVWVSTAQPRIRAVTTGGLSPARIHAAVCVTRTWSLLPVSARRPKVPEVRAIAVAEEKISAALAYFVEPALRTLGGAPSEGALRELFTVAIAVWNAYALAMPA